MIRGKAYNQAISYYPDDDWICLVDYDTLFLLHDSINILTRYTEKFPDVGMFTCFTNRIHTDAQDQILSMDLYNNTNIKTHIERAIEQKTQLYNVTYLKHEISGFLMMINKRTWNEVKFPENMKCLRVDNEYSFKILKSGRTIARMDGLYIFHSYRLQNGTSDTRHLT